MSSMTTFTPSPFRTEVIPVTEKVAFFAAGRWRGKRPGVRLAARCLA